MFESNKNKIVLLYVDRFPMIIDDESSSIVVTVCVLVVDVLRVVTVCVLVVDVVLVVTVCVLRVDDIVVKGKVKLD